jgi:protoporphyrinogen oxidase
MEEKNEVAIIGGGYGGLSAALELVKAGIKVRIFEAESSLGGLASTFKFDGNELEKFYHHWFTTDQAILELVKEFGLESDLIEISSGNRVIVSNRIYDLSKPSSVLNFRAISKFSRLRLGLGVLFARSRVSEILASRLTATKWSSLVFGSEVTRTLWEPLLNRKFGIYHNQIAAQWLQNKLKLRGSSRGQGGQEKLVYLQGGFSKLQNMIVDKLQILGANISTGSKVLDIEQEVGGAYQIKLLSGESYGPFRKVLITTSAPEAIDILSKINATKWKENAQKILYCANRCLIIKTHGKIFDGYWHTVVDKEFPFIAVIDHSNFDPRFADPDTSLLYLSKYMPRDDEDFTLTDEELLSKWGKVLEKICPEFQIAKVSSFLSWKAEFAQPIPTSEYTKVFSKLELIVDDIFFSSMCNIFPQDRGTNFAVLKARQTAQKIISELRGRNAAISS